MSQRGLFDSAEDVHIDKTIRMIELFAGYGSQSMAMKRIGADIQHHFVCEFDRFAIASYNAVHGTDFKPVDIRDVHGSDLNITEKDKYYYFCSYSFPCTDISLAGKRQGYSKGSETRSGLLWEVERILTELHDNKMELPDCLFMENVPQVVSESNVDDFNSWMRFLESIGYHSFIQILNAKNYGIPQNRERAFMFSFLDDVYYDFPKPIKLEKNVIDYLDDQVDERYYVQNTKADKLISTIDTELLERCLSETDTSKT